MLDFIKRVCGEKDDSEGPKKEAPVTEGPETNSQHQSGSLNEEPDQEYSKDQSDAVKRYFIHHQLIACSSVPTVVGLG